MTFNEKLLKVQSELKAPKGQYNSFGKYKYRSCEDILEAVKPLLKENKLTLTISDSLEYVGDRYYIKATATITDGESSVQNSAFAREEETKKGMDGSQITGTASSYARKYCLNGLFLIDDTKDADTDAYKLQTTAEYQKAASSEEEAIVVDILKTGNNNVASINKFVGRIFPGMDDFTSLTIEQLRTLLAELKKYREGK